MRKPILVDAHAHSVAVTPSHDYTIVMNAKGTTLTIQLDGQTQTSVRLQNTKGKLTDNYYFERLCEYAVCEDLPTQTEGLLDGDVNVRAVTAANPHLPQWLKDINGVMA